MNRAVVQNHAQIIDLAPTIMKYLNVQGHESMEGKSLLLKGPSHENLRSRLGLCCTRCHLQR